jgi:predicted dinucleotide-binding enzyme
MRLLLIGGTGPVGASACRLALAHGHEVTVAHSGTHEPPGDLKMKHIHCERDALLALDGPIARARPDVLVVLPRDVVDRRRGSIG